MTNVNEKQEDGLVTTASLEEYVAFIDYIGQTSDGDYIYRFDLTYDTNAVWGEYFNSVPCAVIPNLTPDKNCLSRRAKAKFPREMNLAKNSYCFSMQDCIDGIIPLMFSEIDDDTMEYDNAPLFIRFGEDFNKLSERLKAINITFYDFEDVERGDNSAIDNLSNLLDKIHETSSGEEEDGNIDDEIF